MELLKRYEDPQEFWNEVSPHLKKEETKNNLVLGLSYNFRVDPNGCLYQSALFDGEFLLGAILCTRHRINETLVPTPVKNKESARKLFDDFLKANMLVNGVVAEKETANIYREFLDAQGKEFQLRMTQGIYRCSQVIIPKVSKDVIFRVAQLSDVEVIGEWIESFHNEAVPHDPPVVGVELATTKIEKKSIFVVQKDSEIVSMVGWARDIETSCSVNLVFTPKSYRKNGYASYATTKITQYLLENGKHETNLYTDMTNPISNRIYQDVGYEFVCDSVHYGVSNI